MDDWRDAPAMAAEVAKCTVLSADFLDAALARAAVINPELRAAVLKKERAARRAKKHVFQRGYQEAARPPFCAVSRGFSSQHRS